MPWLVLALACVVEGDPTPVPGGLDPPADPGAPEPLPAAEADPARDDPAALWETPSLPVFSLTLPDDWEDALTDLVAWDPCDDRPYLQGDLVFTNPLTGDDEVWAGVGVRYRGHSALLTPNYSGDTRWGLKLSFEAFAPDRTFHGAERLSLLGTEGDVSLLRERLVLEQMREAGVPAPRANHAWVVVNREPLGVFPLVEEADDAAFVAAHFGEPGGHLYKVPGYCHGATLSYEGEELAAYDGYEPKAGTREEDKATDLVPMLACLESGTSDDAFRSCIESWIDVDRWLTEIAVDMLDANVDGLAATGQNFLLYRPPEGRFVVFPYDLDLAFYTRESDLVGTSIWDLRPFWEPWLPELPRRIREAYADDFCARVIALADDPGAEAWAGRIEAMAAEIDDAVHTDPFLDHEGWRGRVDRLIERVRERHVAARREAQACHVPERAP